MAEPVRFPPPWTVHHNDDAYWVQDASGQRFAYCYFREVQSIGSGMGYMTQDSARRIASNVAKLPDLIRRRAGSTGQDVGQAEAHAHKEADASK